MVKPDPLTEELIEETQVIFFLWLCSILAFFRDTWWTNQAATILQFSL
jgi:hypothetical protein